MYHGQEWTDGHYNYIALLTAENVYEVTDSEGMTMNEKEFEELRADWSDGGEDVLTEVDAEMSGDAKIKRWLETPGAPPLAVPLRNRLS